MGFFLCFHTFPRLCVASWPLQFIFLCWLSFAGFFFTVYESMAKSRKSLPRISTLRSFMSSLDGVSRHSASDVLVQRSLERTKTGEWSLFSHEMQRRSIFNLSLFCKRIHNLHVFIWNCVSLCTGHCLLTFFTVGIQLIYLCLLYKCGFISGPMSHWEL